VSDLGFYSVGGHFIHVAIMAD